jgi:hypothetical protein
MISDAASIEAEPVMIEEFCIRKRLPSFLFKATAQGMEVIKIPPQWSWQLEPVKRVLECLSLPPNWNSYGGKSPSLDTARAAIEFIDMIPYEDPPRPRVIPLSSGGIQLEWHNGERDLEVDFRPDGSALCLKVNAGEDGEEEELKSVSSSDVETLLAWLIAG